MKQIYKSFLVLFCAVTLSGCANTIDGASRDGKDFWGWLSGNPGTEMERSWGKIPRGYGDINQKVRGDKYEILPLSYEGGNRESLNSPVLTKPRNYTQPMVEHNWQVIDNYDGTLPANSDVGTYYDPASPPPPIGADSVPASSASKPSQVTPGVTVYPLEEDGAAVTPGIYEGRSVRVISSEGSFYAEDGQRVFAVSPGMAQSVFFDYGSDRIKSQDKKQLRDIAKDHSQVQKLEVIGHASSDVRGVKDPIKKRMINLEMSMKRATAVSAELIKSGVPARKIKTAGYGDVKPNPVTSGKTQEAADRRVEVFAN